MRTGEEQFCEQLTSLYHNNFYLGYTINMSWGQDSNLLTWDLIMSVCLCACAVEYWSTLLKKSSSLEKIWSILFNGKYAGVKDGSIAPSSVKTEERNKNLEMSQLLCQETQ